MARLRKTIVFPDYIRIKEPDYEVLAELVLRAKGSKRSLNEFAKVCGVNPSTLSRIVNQKNSGPSADTLIKAIAENADPDSNVTLQELLSAHGLAPLVIMASAEKGRNDWKETVKTVTPSEVILKLDGEAEDVKEGSAALIHSAALSIKEINFEKEACNIILASLVHKGYHVKMELGKEWVPFDFVVKTDALVNQGIDTWLFEVKMGIYSSGLRFLDKLFRDLYFHSQYDEGRKVSLVIGDLRAFEGIRENYWDKEIYDLVSVILVDRINRKVVDEFIIPQKGHGRRKSVLVETEERSNGEREE